VLVRGSIVLISLIYFSKVQTPMMCALRKGSFHTRCRLHMGRKFCGRRMPAWTIVSQRSEL
jgi:hypothetical protein